MLPNDTELCLLSRNGAKANRERPDFIHSPRSLCSHTTKQSAAFFLFILFILPQFRKKKSDRTEDGVCVRSFCMWLCTKPN